MGKNNQTRRDFLKAIGIGTGAIGVGAILNPALVGAQGQESGHQDTPPMQGDPVAEMDAHHEEGVQKYLEHIGVEETYWSRPIEFAMDGDVKVFTLTCQNIMWETEAGNPRPGFAYNGTIPGPTIRVTEGDRVRVIVNNEMDQSTAVHWHGLDIPNDQDGVPFITQDVITPGSTYIYEFTAPNPGSHMYHSHHNALEQVVGGLLGAFIIDPLDTRDEPEYEQDYVFILNDSILGFTINGRGFPYTQPLTAKLGERIRVRFYNEGLLSHPMHLHGMPMRVIAKDGYNVPAPYLCDTLHIAPGERYDVIIQARALGIWAFHCHVLSHAESRMGMFGMVTALVITE
jgi:FtsP/CotA-like multicopper oxidase with cupredoxin domain